MYFWYGEEKGQDIKNPEPPNLYTSSSINIDRFCHQVNNAGIVGPTTKHMTDDGLDLTMATNHFGHFLLTNLLLGKFS